MKVRPKRKPIQWPDGARVALTPCVAFETWPEDLGGPKTQQHQNRRAFPKNALTKKDLGAITDRITAEEEGRARAARSEFGEIISTETAKLAERHPDWDTFLKQHGGPAFAAWVDDQPRRIREALAVNGDAIVDADGAIALIDAYKQHLGVTPAARR